MHTNSSWPAALKAPFQGVAKHARCMVVVAGMTAVLMLSTVVPSRQWPNGRSTTAQRLAAPFKGIRSACTSWPCAVGACRNIAVCTPACQHTLNQCGFGACELGHPDRRHCSNMPTSIRRARAATMGSQGDATRTLHNRTWRADRQRRGRARRPSDCRRAAGAWQRRQRRRQ
jgi:hypothetical protein